MDRPISNQAQHKKRLSKWSKVLLSISLLVIAFWFLRTTLTPGVSRNELQTSIVELGEVMATISASGVVVPDNERIVSAVFASEVQEVLAMAGAKVEVNDPILVLDSRPLEVEIQDLEEKLALKENARLSSDLALQSATNDAKGRYELRKIDLESRQAKYGRLSILAKSGLISKGDLLEAELNVRRTSVELNQLEVQMQNQQASNQAELDRITLETAILQNQLDEKRRLLNLTTVRAPHAGVLTWVLDELGTRTTEGQPLARIADLSAYRIEATLSDFYAPRLLDGQQVLVESNDLQLQGQLQSVLPTVENGALKLLVQLDNPSAIGLRPQLRVDVDIVTGLASETARLRKGLGLTGSGRQQVYRINNGRASRIAVQFGLSNRNYLQVLEGLKPGDEVIVSDSSTFEHLDQLEVN